jgi:hypothetical protein
MLTADWLMKDLGLELLTRVSDSDWWLGIRVVFGSI